MAKSTLLRYASRTAEKCSGTLPTKGTSTNPMNALGSPHACTAGWIDFTRISETTPVATAARASITTDSRRVQVLA